MTKGRKFSTQRDQKRYTADTKTKKQGQKKNTWKQDQKKNWQRGGYDAVPIPAVPPPSRKAGPRALLITCGQESDSWEAIKTLMEEAGRKLVDALALKRDPHERKVRVCLKTSVSKRKPNHTPESYPRITHRNHTPNHTPNPTPKNKRERQI